MLQNNNIDRPRIWVVVPVFNNKGTVFNIVSECRKRIEHVLVVDDGSTDVNVENLFSGTDITVLKHKRNLGKGTTIRTALQYLRNTDAEFILTIDADGQHCPGDIERFIPFLKQDKSAIIIGSRDFNSPGIPGKSRFGRKFSNFWLKLETGCVIDDSQSGFRAYPVKHISRIKLYGNHYDFEIEILTRAVWAGLKLREVPINVFYPEAGLRVSSFRPFIDNLRISLMHARLIGRRFLPLPYPRLVPLDNEKIRMDIISHPIKLLKTLLKENSAPLDLAVSSGVGIFLGVLPLVSVHMLVIIYVTSRLHLNRIMALAIQNLCMPPLVPIACIELGYFMRYGRWLTDISWGTTFGSIPERLWEWLLGSLILAPIMAVSVALIVYFISLAIQKRVVRYAK